MLGENGTFLCNSTPAGFTTLWRLEKEKTVILDTDRLLSQGLASSLNGIFLSGYQNGDTYSSMLTITGSTEKNFTTVQCTFATGIFPENQFNDVPFAFLRVLGEK